MSDTDGQVSRGEDYGTDEEMVTPIEGSDKRQSNYVEKRLQCKLRPEIFWSFDNKRRRNLMGGYECVLDYVIDVDKQLLANVLGIS